MLSSMTSKLERAKLDRTLLWKWAMFQSWLEAHEPDERPPGAKQRTCCIQ